MSHTIVEAERCGNDGICVESCPVHLLELRPGVIGPQGVEKAAERCVRCGHCVAVCPRGALALETIPRSEVLPLRRELQPTAEAAEQFLRARRSIRRYKPELVSHELIERAITAAGQAPSGHNRQPVRWTVVTGHQTVHALAAGVIDWMRRMVAEQSPMAEMLGMPGLVSAWERGQDQILRDAPHVVLAHAPRTDAMGPSSCTIAMAYLQLTAAAQGLGTCWAGFLQIACGMERSLARSVGIPDGDQVHAATMLGRPKYSYSAIPPRKKADIGWRSTLTQ